MRVSLCGAAGEVTGSGYLVQTAQGAPCWSTLECSRAVELQMPETGISGR